MRVRIEPDGQLPVYTQLKEQIRFLILSGELGPGARLPTARQLAGFLRVNRNTVLKAYRELVKESLIECRRGRGCWVVDRPTAVSQSVPSRLLEIIDSAIEQAGELGVSTDDFATFAYARAKQRRDVSPKRRLAFVECEVPVVTALSQMIQGRLDVQVIPVLLRDAQQATDEVRQLLREVDVVATTFFHIQEVKELLEKTKQTVVALAVKPHLDNLVQIAAIEKGTPVLLVCVSEAGALETQRSLEDAGVTGLDFSYCGADDPDRLAEILPQHPVVIASDFVASDVRPLVHPDQTLIVLDYTTLDEGAMYLLRVMIGEEPLAIWEAGKWQARATPSPSDG